MKRSVRVLSFAIAFTILVSSLGFSAFAADAAFKEKFQDFAAKGIEFILDSALSAVARILPDGDNFFDYDTYEGEYFLGGSGDYREPSETNGKWSLGSSSVSLVPDDYTERAII